MKKDGTVGARDLQHGVRFYHRTHGDCTYIRKQGGKFAVILKADNQKVTTVSIESILDSINSDGLLS